MTSLFIQVACRHLEIRFLSRVVGFLEPSPSDCCSREVFILYHMLIQGGYPARWAGRVGFSLLREQSLVED
jgi:hypothetical protein